MVLYRKLRNGNVLGPIRTVRGHVENGRRFVISCEGFWLLPRATLASFTSGINDLGFEVRCLVVFRPQVDYLVSHYLQLVKAATMHWSIGLEDYVIEAVKKMRSGKANLSWLFVCEELAEVFGKDKLSVYWYPSLINSGLDEVVKRFFAWIDVAMPEGYTGRGIVNPSPNGEALMILRMMNSAGLGGRAFANEFLAQAHAAKLLDKRPMLSKEHLALIDGLTRRDNQEMLKRYAPGYSAEPVGDSPVDQPLLRKEVVAEMLQMAGQVLARQGTAPRLVSGA